MLQEGDHPVSQLRLSVDGGRDADVALWQWLRGAPDLRGKISREQGPSPAGAMGGTTELVVALASTGTLAAVARAVGVWLTQRHADITVTITLPDGRTVALDAQRVQPGDVERLLQTCSDATPPELPPPAGAP
jgi:hypothetical protein